MKTTWALVLALLPAAVPADTLRCGDRLVYEGDAIAKVETLCGKPTQITTSTLLKPQTYWLNGRPYLLSDREVIVPVETWLYNFGPQKLMRRLRFEDGVLVQIETLDYGYHEE